MAVIIDADDARSIKALEFAADAGQWLHCRTRDGAKAYGIRSSRNPNHVYLVTSETCTCSYAAFHGGAKFKHVMGAPPHAEVPRAPPGAWVRARGRQGEGQVSRRN